MVVLQRGELAIDRASDNVVVLQRGELAIDRASDNMVREALAEAMNVSCSEYKIMMETQGSDRNKLYAETAMSNGGTGELDENSGCRSAV